jgi:hypothetical protein
MTDRLNISRLHLYDRLSEQVQNAAYRAINFYIEEARRLDLKWNERVWNDGTVKGCDFGVGVSVEWDEYARGCRVDGGSFTIPWEALADDTYKIFITEMVSNQVVAVAKREKEEETRRIEFKRRELERLIAELGEQ